MPVRVVPHGGEYDDVFFAPFEAVNSLDFDERRFEGPMTTEDTDKVFAIVWVGIQETVEELDLCSIGRDDTDIFTADGLRRRCQARSHENISGRIPLTGLFNNKSSTILHTIAPSLWFTRLRFRRDSSPP